MRATVAAIAVLTLLACETPPPDERFVARSFTDSSGTVLPFRLFIPHEQPTTGGLPLILFLHGGSGAGNDNRASISAKNRIGSHIWIKRTRQANHPAFVVAPQLPAMSRWDSPGSAEMTRWGRAAVQLVETLIREHAIDPRRIYVTGQSLGGWGVWELITKRPDLFAAAVPVCGGGDPGAAPAAKDVNIWVFHGRRDRTVPAERSREMVAALERAGAPVRYTEYRFSGHTIWKRAYKEKGLADWLFAQKKDR